MLENILESCSYVSHISKHVKINYDNIDKFLSNIIYSDTKHWLYNSPFGLLDFSNKEIINFLIVYHSIGFSYWGSPKWTIDTDHGKIDGAYAMMYILVNEMRNNKDFFKPINLENISIQKLSNLLKGNVEIPLFKQRYENIRHIGKVINTKMNGDFYSHIENVTSDKELFDIIINCFDIFNDVTDYCGTKIYFYKLAQLLVSDILYYRNYLRDEKKQN